MKIGLIGTGRLGICLALLMGEAGYEVLASDVREDYVQSLNNKQVDNGEPLVKDLLIKSTNVKFTTDNKQVIRECDVIYTLVATPSLDDGSYDVSAVWNVVKDIRDEMTSIANYTKAFVVGCTTNPGDCDKFQKELPPSVDVYYNPEFIAQGSIVKDLRHADMVLVGGEGIHRSFIKHVYQKIQEGYREPSIHFMTTKAAELTKIAVNCFLTTKISFANMMGEVLTLSKLDDEIDTVLDAIGSDSRIGNKYLNFGFGFGGPCFPRDNRAFGTYARSVGLDYNFGETTDAFNKEHAEFMKEYFIYLNTERLPYLFESIAYKEGTDILTESQQYRLCLDLLNEGYDVYVKDDCVKGKCDGRIKFEEPDEAVFMVML